MPVDDKKTAQLCAQAERTLGSVIQNELLDANLDGLVLIEVRPYLDADHLLVVVSVPKRVELPVAKQAREGAAGRLREALGRALSRKRVPLLSFSVFADAC